jgi:hypothetical protein
LKLCCTGRRQTQLAIRRELMGDQQGCPLASIVLHKQGSSFQLPFAAARLVAGEGGSSGRLLMVVSSMEVVREFVAGPYYAQFTTEQGDELRGQAAFDSSRYMGYIEVEFTVEDLQTTPGER